MIDEILGLTDYLKSSNAFQLSGITWNMLSSLTLGYWDLSICLKIILLIPFLFWLSSGIILMFMGVSTGILVYPLYLINKVGLLFLNWASEWSEPDGFDRWGFWKIILFPLLIWTLIALALALLIVPNALFSSAKANLY